MCLRRYILAVASLLSFAQGLAAQVLTDSAGVKVIENIRPAFSPLSAWRVPAVPYLRIGTTGRDTASLLSGVVGVVTLASGQIAIANRGSGVLRLFDSLGTVVRSTGRFGRGRAEFEDILGVHLLRGDTIVVADRNEEEYFAEGTTHVRTVGPRDAVGRNVHPHGYFPDGGYAGLALRSAERVDASTVDSLLLILVRPDGSFGDSLGTVPVGHQRHDASTRAPRPVTFGPLASIAVHDGLVYYGFGERYEIRVYSHAGRLERLIRRKVTRRPVTPADVAEFRTFYTNMRGEDGRALPREMRQMMQQSLATMPFADSFPAFASLLVDRLGHLWVRQYEPPDAYRSPNQMGLHVIAARTRWDVFDPAGRWLFTSELPDNFTPLEIGDAHVAGLHREAGQPDQVWFFRLIKR